MGDLRMERTIYAYKIKPVCISDKKPLMINNIEKDLYDIVNNLCQKSLLDRKRDFTSDKICSFFSYLTLSK